jgi:hypothetical protein
LPARGWPGFLKGAYDDDHPGVYDLHTTTPEHPLSHLPVHITSILSSLKFYEREYSTIRRKFEVKKLQKYKITKKIFFSPSCRLVITTDHSPEKAKKYKN